MPSERDEFLAAIKANWTDFELRGIFADWLEERGEEAEAAEQRGFEKRFKEAQQWLADFADRIGGPGWYGQRQEEFGYDELMKAATNYLETNECLNMGTNDAYLDEHHNREELWKNYSIVTGREVEDKFLFFRCAC